MTTLFPWFVAGVSTTSFVALWFTVAYKELSCAKQNIENAKRQMRLHRDLSPLVRGGAGEAAANHSFSTAQMIYNESIKSYAHIRQKPMNWFPAFLFGFRSTKQI